MFVQTKTMKHEMLYMYDLSWNILHWNFSTHLSSWSFEQCINNIKWLREDPDNWCNLTQPRTNDREKSDRTYICSNESCKYDDTNRMSIAYTCDSVHSVPPIVLPPTHFTQTARPVVQFQSPLKTFFLSTKWNYPSKMKWESQKLGKITNITWT